jgi:NADPH:quinone reductase-like Zn-dependent oxidoreductase
VGTGRLESGRRSGAATAPVSYGALVRVTKVQDGEAVLVHAAARGLGVVAVRIARAMARGSLAQWGAWRRQAS